MLAIFNVNRDNKDQAISFIVFLVNNLFFLYGIDSVSEPAAEIVEEK